MIILKTIIIIGCNSSRANQIILHKKKVLKVLIHLNIQAKNLKMNNLITRNNTFK